MRHAAIIIALTFAACGGDSRELEVADFLVRHDGSTLTITQAKTGLTLSTAPGKIARTRSAVATYEAQFGAFKIQEQQRAEPRIATTIGDFEDGSAALLDAAGESMGTISFSALQGSLQITIAAPGADRTALAFACDPASDGDYLGFGAQTHDVDHRGQIVPLWVEEQGIGKTDTNEYSPLWPLVGTRHSSYLPIPSIVAPRAEHSYGLRSTTLERSIWDVCATDPGTLLIEAWESSITVQIAPGPTALDVLEQQTKLSGRPPLGPDWTFGVWMEAIGGRQAVSDEVQRLEDARIPFSAIWTEDWRGGQRQGRSYALDEDWRADDVLYPMLDDTIGLLHGKNLHFMTYFNTFVVEDADVFPEAVRDQRLVKKPDGEPYYFDGVTFKRTGLVDLFDPSARTWVRTELENALNRGIDGWMADFAEWYPAERRDVVAPEGLTPTAAHQMYPVEWARVNQEAVGDRKDVVIFHRSGYSGSQASAHVIWAGDQRTSFDTDDGFPTVIPILIGLSMTGFPVVTHDIGGYISSTNPPTSRDLFYRWTSLGALGPVMRTHHGRDIDFNWRWSRDAATIAHFERWARWHVRHAPMWKGLARQATDHGQPILRPLALVDPGDARLAGVKDEYMIGDNYLVAPVVTASTTHRSVLIPRGTWYPLDRGPPIQGPSEIDAMVPLSEVAIWARAGAVVPQAADALTTLTTPADQASLKQRRVVEIWLGAPGKARDGEGGTWTLDSPKRPATFASVEGGMERVRTATVVEIEAAANAHLLLRETDGTVHRVDGTDHPAEMSALYRLLW